MIVATREHRGLNRPVRHVFETVEHVVRRRPSIGTICPVRVGPIMHHTTRRRLSNYSQVRVVRPLSILSFRGFLTEYRVVLASDNNIRRRTPSLNGPILIVHSAARHPRNVRTNALGLIKASRRAVCRDFGRLLRGRTSCSGVDGTDGPCNSKATYQRVTSVLRGKVWSKSFCKRGGEF